MQEVLWQNPSFKIKLYLPENCIFQIINGATRTTVLTETYLNLDICTHDLIKRLAYYGRNLALMNVQKQKRCDVFHLWCDE